MSDSLEALHEQIGNLADPDGGFVVVCPLSGKRPVPVRGKSFPSAASAETAVDLVVAYRHRLGEFDPHLENIPVVACERDADPFTLADPLPLADFCSGETSSSASASSSTSASSSVTLFGDGEDAWLRMDDAPVVRVREDGTLLSDDAIERQLQAKL
jgi:hypothetical protein